MDYSKLFVVAALAASAVPAAAAPVAAPTPAKGKALILIPLTLTKAQDLDFGSVVPSPVSGMVAIDATTGNRTIAGGITGIASAPGQRAYFGGAGSPNQQVFVSITSPGWLTSTTTPADQIQLLALTLEGSSLKTIDPVSHAFVFGVGGVIMVGVNQPEGVYEATFTVTANYQ